MYYLPLLLSAVVIVGVLVEAKIGSNACFFSESAYWASPVSSLKI